MTAFGKFLPPETAEFPAAAPACLFSLRDHDYALQNTDKALLTLLEPLFCASGFLISDRRLSTERDSF
ncbi:MAG: hypothetical protein DBY36_07055 [Clostridiales bacterium]|nr:MAG: hypothetical protein DBY36_07055 [Clostridiales bacterium]